MISSVTSSIRRDITLRYIIFIFIAVCIFFASCHHHNFASCFVQIIVNCTMSTCGNNAIKRQRAKHRKRRYLRDSNPVMPRQSLKKWHATEVLPYHDGAGHTEQTACADVESDSSDSHLSTTTTCSTEQFDEVSTTLDR